MTDSKILERFRIIEILPFLRDHFELRQQLVAKLANLGVDEAEDLAEVKPEDLSPPLPLIKARRLITQWKKDILHDEATNPNRSNLQRDEIAVDMHSQVNHNAKRAILVHGIYNENPPPPRPLTDEEDILQNLDSYCEELKEFLVNKAKSLCSVDQVSCVDRRVTTAPLQISRTTREYLSDEVGHYHRRREISELLNEPPKSDVSVEELFVKANEHAEELASKKQLFTKESRLKYIDANGNIVCVLGQAGMGKTTLTRVLLNRVVSEEKLYDADFIFYLQFRDLEYGHESNILSFLAKDFSATWMEKKSHRNAVLNRLAESKVCIIMDGFDEANLDSDLKSSSTRNHNDEATAEAFIWNLFRGNIFPKAKKLITSRPRQLLELPEELRPQFVVNILGLDIKAQKEICKDICDTNDDFVFNYTQDHPDISSYCFAPVNCILVMHCINELSRVGKSNCRMPTTLTGILVVVLCLFIDTPQVSKHVKFEIESLRNLAELAWNGFMRNKYYFNESDLEKAGFKKEQRNTFFTTILGKNNLSEIFKGQSPKHTYFSHLLWQEFFVAIKLMFFVTPDYFKTTFSDKTETKDLSSDQSEQMKFDFTDSRFEMVAKFVFGLCNVTTYNKYLLENFHDLEFPSSRVEMLQHMALQNLPNVTSKETFQAFLQTCTWVNEMHDEVFTKDIADEVSEDLTVHGGEIVPSDVAGFHYILRARSQPISISFGTLKAEFHSSSSEFYFRGDSLIRFFKEMHKTIQSSSVLMKRLDLQSSPIGDEGAYLLSTCINKIEDLRLPGCGVTSKGVQDLASEIKLLTKPMKRLDLQSSPIGDEGAYLLSTCINKIEDLGLHDCGVTSKGVQDLASEIKLLTKPMKRLDLQSSPIGDEGAYLLSTCINKIEDLRLPGCGVTSKGVQDLASEIKLLTKPMKRLDLQSSPIGDEGAYLLSTCINKIEDLGLHDCGVTSKGVQDLASEIKLLTKPMKRLDLGFNPIEDEGAYHLSTCINKIEDLGLCYCQIAYKGVQNLSSKVQHLTKPMKLLDISYMNIGEDGFIAISSCIDKLEKLRIGNGSDTVPMAAIEALAAAVQNRREPMEELEVHFGYEFAKEFEDKLNCCRSKVKSLILIPSVILNLSRRAPF